MWSQPCLSEEMPLHQDASPPSPLSDSICSHKFDCLDYRTISISLRRLPVPWYQGNAGIVWELELLAHARHPLPTVNVWEEFVLSWAYASGARFVGCSATWTFSSFHKWRMPWIVPWLWLRNVCALQWLLRSLNSLHIISLTFVPCRICCALPCWCWHWKPGSSLPDQSISSQVCSYFPFKALPFGFRWQALAFPTWVHWLPLYPLCFLSLPYLRLTGSLLPTLLG